MWPPSTEEPIPEYDYSQVADTIDQIDRKIVKINTPSTMPISTSQIQVGDEVMTVDQILIRMASAQPEEKLSGQPSSKLSPKVRINAGVYSARQGGALNTVISIDDLEVAAGLRGVDEELGKMQMAPRQAQSDLRVRCGHLRPETDSGTDMTRGGGPSRLVWS